MTDITYIRTYEGWLYLAVVIDLHARLVVGWSMQARMQTRLVLDALTMAVWRGKPKTDSSSTRIKVASLAAMNLPAGAKTID